MRKARGFTLIEMVVVVIILGILASIASATYTKTVEKARGVEAKEALLKAYAGYKRLLIDGQSVASLNWTGLGMSNPDSSYFTYTFFPGGNPTQVRAARVGDNTKWLNVSLADGSLTASDPY